MFYKLIRPYLFQVDPEKIHSRLFKAGTQIQKLKLLPMLKTYCKIESSRLSQNVAGVTFNNPIGLAAGFDKNAKLIPLLDALGFGFIEIGSITALASKGNPAPRVFRLPKDKAIINRMGLNNDGATALKKSLKNVDPKLPFAINIAKTHSPKILGDAATEDFLDSYKKLRDFGLYTAINISCPNTKEGKTFEKDKQALSSLLEALSQEKGSRPLFLKLSPDLESNDLKMIINVATQNSIDGFIVGNTSNSRDDLQTDSKRIQEIGRGGLSGAPLRDRSNQVIAEVYRQTNGEFPIIGTGGIMSSFDVLEKIKYGASLVQLYTGLIYNGPFFIRQLNLELDNFLKDNNIKHIDELRGAYHGN